MAYVSNSYKKIINHANINETLCVQIHCVTHLGTNYVLRNHVSWNNTRCIGLDFVITSYQTFSSWLCKLYVHFKKNFNRYATALDMCCKIKSNQRLPSPNIYSWKIIIPIIRFDMNFKNYSIMIFLSRLTTSKLIFV